MSYPNWIYSAFAFTGFLLVTIPFPWHLEAWNTGTCLYMAWTAIACLIQFINSIVWNGNAYNPAPIWCDISTRLMIGTTVAIPAASLCINRRLYHISCVKSVTHSRAEKRRAVAVDLAIGLGIPLVEMILQYITQGHRYNIFEDVGCYPFTYNTWVAVLLVYLPPIIIGLVSAIYCILSIRAFNQSREQFSQILSYSSNLKAGRFIRLMMLAGTEVVCTVPIGCYALYLNIAVGLEPWISWENVHVGFSRVDQFPAIIWKNIPLMYSSLELTRWLVVVCAFIFFGYFGFADEARKNYRSALGSVSKRVGYTSTGFGIFSFNGSRSKSGDSLDSTGSLPVHIHSEILRKKDSIDSFSNMSVSINDVGGTLKSGELSEKHCVPVLAYDSLRLPDLGGVLADHDSRPVSAAPSSGSSSSSDLDFPIESPQPAYTRPNSTMIEISSVRRPSYVDSIVIPQSSMIAPRHSIDAPCSVPRGSFDIV